MQKILVCKLTKNSSSYIIRSLADLKKLHESDYAKVVKETRTELKDAINSRIRSKSSKPNYITVFGTEYGFLEFKDFSLYQDTWIAKPSMDNILANFYVDPDVGYYNTNPDFKGNIICEYARYCFEKSQQDGFDPNAISDEEVARLNEATHKKVKEILSQNYTKFRKHTGLTEEDLNKLTQGEGSKKIFLVDEQKGKREYVLADFPLLYTIQPVPGEVEGKIIPNQLPQGTELIPLNGLVGVVTKGHIGS